MAEQEHGLEVDYGEDEAGGEREHDHGGEHDAAADEELPAAAAVSPVTAESPGRSEHDSGFESVQREERREERHEERRNDRRDERRDDRRGERREERGQPEPKRPEPKQEWEQMDIPLEWRPLPLLRVRRRHRCHSGAATAAPSPPSPPTLERRPLRSPLPCPSPSLPSFQVWGIPKDAPESEVADALGAAGLSVHSVTLDPKQESATGASALVRLQPPPLPWEPSTGGDTATPEEPAEADVGKLAEAAVTVLRAADPPPALRGEPLHFERSHADVALFLANLPAALADDAALRKSCAEHGALTRCFLRRGSCGGSKAYGYAEYALPAGAAACREAFARLAEEMKPARVQPGERRSSRCSARVPRPLW